ncbi:MAG TPA: tetratricopeptide repeat protein [Candidatus Saccharimonadales bacterium]|nr:tetratricopeptide repeat protein [Candidatus Saccharimonadales bacterium]
MYSIIFVILAGIMALYASTRATHLLKPMQAKTGGRLQKLWQDFHIGVSEKKYLRAEKALLTILRADQRNAMAYSRLGILYAKQKAYADAIECFEIAQSIEPMASSLHNLGLIYYETEQHQNAAHAFERALEMEDDLAARHIAYAKVQEKLGNQKRVVESLERAVHLEPNPQTFALLIDAYERIGENEKAKTLKEKIEKLKASAPTTQRVQQPRRVVM